MADKKLYRLAQQVGEALKARALMLVTAESCTGGWVGEVVTMVPGSSDWYERGFVTYQSVAKHVFATNATPHGDCLFTRSAGNDYETRLVRHPELAEAT